MQCPLCLETQLEPRFAHGVEIDVCPRCRGMWLDRGELDRMLDSPVDELLDRPAAPPRPAAPEVPNAPTGAAGEPWHAPRPSNPSGERPATSGKKRKKSRAERLADLFEEVLDF